MQGTLSLQTREPDFGLETGTLTEPVDIYTSPVVFPRCARCARLGGTSAEAPRAVTSKVG